MNESFDEAALPPLYAKWLRTVAGGPIPAETRATCDKCAMLAAEGASPNATHFHPVTKCCAYQPSFPNFLAGRILADADPQLQRGRETLEHRIRQRAGVSLCGIRSNSAFGLLYTHTPNVFGRAPALKCPHLAADGGCGVWRHRPGVCATWFCKHVRGETGFRFWSLAAKLLREVEHDLELWCASRLSSSAGELKGLEAEVVNRPDVSELGGEIDWAAYSSAWGAWIGREAEFYKVCAELVAPLAWDDVLAACGPRVGILAQLVRDAYEHLTSNAMPERLRLGSVQLAGMVNGKYLVVSYSNYDPLAMPAGLAGVLSYFDGRPVEDSLASILAERNLRVGVPLVRKMLDFGILKAAEVGPFAVLE